MPAQFGELSFGTRKADNKPIKLKYWEPSPYSYEELKIFHRVLVDGEPFDPKIIDYSWRDGAAYDPSDQNTLDRRNAHVRATHGFFPPFMSCGDQCDEIWNNKDPDLYFNGGLLLMGDGLDPGYKRHWPQWYAQAMLQRKLKPGSTHEITVEVCLHLLAKPSTVGMIEEETNEEKEAWLRDPMTAGRKKERGDFERQVTGDGMIPLPITKALARGSFKLHVPEDYVPSGLMPRYPKGLAQSKNPKFTEIEKSMSDSLKAFVSGHRDYAKEIFQWCVVVNDKAPGDKEDFSEDDVWQFETYNEKERYTKNGQEYTVTKQKERWFVNGLAYFYRRPGVWKDDDTGCQAGVVTAAWKFVGHGNQKKLPLQAWNHDGFGPNVPVEILTDADIEMTGFNP